MKGFMLVVTMMSSTSVFARNPINESADYKLDKNRQRTSSVVRSGSTVATVTKEIKMEDGKKKYEVKVSYDLEVFLSGRQQGDQFLTFPEEFFTEEFLVSLRDKKHYESSDFKMDHLGFADAKNMDGQNYPHCDKVKIYDIKSPPSFDFLDLVETFQLALSSLNPTSYLATEQPKDMEVIGLISYGQPVLGAVKLDISGTMNGFKVYTGFDFTRPQK